MSSSDLSPSPDVQREFYESGYGGDRPAPALTMVEFDRQGACTRVSRAAAMLAGARGTFLDVGCGRGPLLYALRGQFTDLIGVDIAEAQLAHVRDWARAAGCPVTLHRSNLDVEPLPLTDASVDAASCMVVLEFVLRPDFMVGEIARVLRPGGILVCSTGNIVSWKNRLRVLAGLDPRTTVFRAALNGGALHHFTQATFVRLLEQAGLVVEEIGCSGRWWQIRRHWPALLGGDILVRARKSFNSVCPQGANA